MHRLRVHFVATLLLAVCAASYGVLVPSWVDAAEPAPFAPSSASVANTAESEPGTAARPPLAPSTEDRRGAESSPAAPLLPGHSSAPFAGSWLDDPDELVSPERLKSTLRMMMLLTVISIAPTLLVMTTSFVRIVVVLGLLRQAIGAQQLPSTQVLSTLALFLSLLVMSPVWKQVYDQAVLPYTEHQIDWETACERGAAPIRHFMSLQIERTGNADDVWLFLDRLPEANTPTSYDDVPLAALLPAFMLSELKTAFLMGFQIFLPFLVLDLVVSSVMVAMGMLMVPPSLVSLPFKLLLFVLVDGWHLVVGMLLDSFAPFV